MALIDMKSNLANISKNKTDLTSQKEANAKSNHSKLRADDDQLVVRKIGKRYRSTKLDGGLSRGGAALQIERSVEDTKRIGKFLFSGKGALFTVKQSILQKQNRISGSRFSVPEAHGSQTYNPLSIFANLDPRGNKQRHFNREIINGVKNYEEFIEQDKLFGHRGTRQGYQEVKGAVNFMNPNKRGKLNVEYGGNFGDLGMWEGGLSGSADSRNRLGKDQQLPKDFIDFRIRDAVNGKWIIFPALITGITDNSQASYNPINYIGRPEAVYVYQNRTRSISFNLKVVALNENDIEINWVKINQLKGLTQPEYKKFFNDNDTEGMEETRPVAPYVYLTIGDMFRSTPGFFESVNLTIPENSSWETIAGKQFPHMCDISLSFTYIGNEMPTMRGINYDGIFKGELPEGSTANPGEESPKFSYGLKSRAAQRDGSI